jgi:glutaredoxin
MITVYSKPQCPFCDQAKALLEQKGIPFTTVDVSVDPHAREKIMDLGLRSVPQIFNDGVLLPGGYQGLAGQPEEFWTTLKG